MIYVMCHSGSVPQSDVTGQSAEDLIYHHLPFWKAHNHPITFVSADDKPFKSGHRDIIVKHSGENERAAYQFLAILEDIILNGNDSTSYIYEYDSICLDVPKTSLPRGFYGNAKYSESPHFPTQRFLMAPWAIDRESAKKIYDFARSYFDLNCKDNDRLISSWAHYAGVPLLSWGNLGYSDNTIREGHLLVLERLRPFPIWIHGIKSVSILRSIFHFWQKSS